MQKFETQKTDQNINAREAIIKVRLKAMSAAPNEIAESAVNFIEQNQISGTFIFATLAPNQEINF